MRYMAAIVLAAALLSGCQGADKAAVNGSSSAPSTASPTTGLPTAVSATPSASAPSSEEEPLLYIEQLRIIGGGGQLIQVKSNTDINKQSLEQALKKSLQTSTPEAEFRYTLEWESPRFVQIRLHLDESSAWSGTFTLDEAVTADGRKYASTEQPYRNTVVVRAQAGQGSLLFQGITSGTRRVVPAWNTGWIKSIQTAESSAPSYLFYGQEKHHLVQALKGEALEIPAFPQEKDAFGNDYGYHEMYSDRFYGDFTYMISGNKTLYLVDLKAFTRTKLHVFNKPVYGMSSSPDGKRIAVLTAHYEFIGPGADLTVLDQKGKILHSKENAAFISHSDGFLFVYSLTWEDDSHLILPTDRGEKNPLGQIRYNTGSGTSTVMQDKRITDQLKQDLTEHEQQPHNDLLLSELRWSPDNRFAAFKSGTGTIQVYDTQERTFTFVSAGTLLDWMPDGTLAWADAGDHVYTF
ncbi:hypothetical protein C162_12868 [Paenibacillus sp. FSL R7-269]|uniref:hypothetical protein n=1 Tax=Paenibacillus sp. FSL R7-269 TaxID=1226755 RepID=UPI0003E1CA31|nr:hypothetical protein [Paenibacillus sp. FSL R7-269]ETT49778.1 hypothetical protein C162_12868 [Paenibacillus sp. FSL R7-269]